MTHDQRKGTNTPSRQSGKSVRRSARLRAADLFSADGAYVSEDRAATRSFSFLSLLVDPERTSTRHDVVERLLTSSRGLLEALATTTARDDHGPINRGPRHGRDYAGLTGEQPEAIPQRRRERIREFIMLNPALDIDQLAGTEGGDSTRPPGACRPRRPAR